MHCNMYVLVSATSDSKGSMNWGRKLDFICDESTVLTKKKFDLEVQKQNSAVLALAENG